MAAFGPLADAEWQRRELDRDRRARQLLAADWRDVLGRESGRRLFWHLIDNLTNARGGSFVAGMPDATAYNEGRRSIGIELMQAALANAPASYVQMVSEALALQRDAAPPPDGDTP